MITEEELVQYAKQKLECAIRVAMSQGILLGSKGASRVIPRPHGFNTCYWDYRRNRVGAPSTTYGLDAIIVGSIVITGITQQHAVGRALHLPNKYLSNSIDCGFQSYSLSDCDDSRTPLSQKLYYLGRGLRDLL